MLVECVVAWVVFVAAWPSCRLVFATLWVACDLLVIIIIIIITQDYTADKAIGPGEL
jgi:hypothetical protein